MMSRMVAAAAAGAFSLFATAALACSGPAPCAAGPTLLPDAGFAPAAYDTPAPPAGFAGPEPQLYGAPAPSRYGPAPFEIGAPGPRPLAPPPVVAHGPCRACIAEAPPPAREHHHLRPSPAAAHGVCAVHSACYVASEAAEAPPLEDTFFLGGLSGGAGPGLEEAWYSGGGGFSAPFSGFAEAEAFSHSFASARAYARAVAIVHVHHQIPHKAGCGCAAKHGK